jgi:hypothetical protein
VELLGVVVVFVLRLLLFFGVEDVDDVVVETGVGVGGSWGCICVCIVVASVAFEEGE